MTEFQPSWKRIARVPESSLKHQLLRDLGVEHRDDASWSRDYAEEGFLVRRLDDGSFCTWKQGMSVLLPDGSDVLKAAGWTRGTAVGDALRAYLSRWGWVPKSKRQAEPQENTKMIV